MLHTNTFSALLLIVIMAFTSIVSLAQIKADDVTGTWITEAKDGSYAHIEIYRTGNIYNGKITWLSDPNENGKPKTDHRNPDKSKRMQPLSGLNLLSGFVFDGNKEWEEGKIYDPSSGNTYKCFMWMDGHNTLNVKGYVGISLLGKAATWKRLI